MREVHFIYAEIGIRIREARKKKGVTQARLAEILSLTRTSVTNIEKGRQQILVHTLYELSDALTVPLAALLPRRDALVPEIASNVLPKDLSSKERKWVKSIVEGGAGHTDQTAKD